MDCVATVSACPITRTGDDFSKGTAVIQEAYDKLRKLIEEAGEDISKAEGGNKAAGTRVRKIMQDVKQAAQDLRVGVLDIRKDD